MFNSALLQSLNYGFAALISILLLLLV